GGWLGHEAKGVFVFLGNGGGGCRGQPRRRPPLCYALTRTGRSRNAGRCSPSLGAAGRGGRGSAPRGFAAGRGSTWSSRATLPSLFSRLLVSRLPLSRPALSRLPRPRP